MEWRSALRHRNLQVIAALMVIAGLASCVAPPLGSTDAAQNGTGADSKTATSSSYTLLYSFRGGKDGANPAAALLDVGGTLYGSTVTGGDGHKDQGNFGDGTLFSISASGGEQVLYRFKKPSGFTPESGLTRVDNYLFGTTSEGGQGSRCSLGCGMVFKITTSGTLQALYYFNGSPDGAGPLGNLLTYRNRLYGVTYSGGQRSNGAIFEVGLTGRERVLYSFHGGRDGGTPYAGLLDHKGLFYGTTRQGGKQSCSTSLLGCGTIFTVDQSGVEDVVYRFQGGGDGAMPESDLTELHGRLYGTTFLGGGTLACNGGCGTVFEFDPTSHTERVIYSFRGGFDGMHPAASLTVMNGKLYGTTELGGYDDCLIINSCGTVFEVTTSGAERILYAFRGPFHGDGEIPQGGRLTPVNGVLYGTTDEGGAHCSTSMGCGTVFAIRPQP
jgi:uncharacterized repeat protein (TIGR03803 family)